MYISKFSNFNNGVIECALCNHRCKINEGNVGLCGVRKNINGELTSLVYARPSFFDIDPIEKKPLFHFMPGTVTYSLSTWGCNLKCANCQSHSISQVNNVEKIINKIDEVSPERIIENVLADDCPSVSYTYNEPTVFTEYALDIMKLAHKNSIKNIWVSNGYMSDECLDAIIPYLDAINVDLKSFDDGFYRDTCSARLQPILKNLIRLKMEQVHLELTTLIIPGLSSDMEMIKELTDFIVCELDADTPWHITRFSPEISWKLKEYERTGEDLIYEAYEIGKEAGLKYIYVGNIPGDQKENTYCPKCGELAIRRFGYHVERLDNNGCCPTCDRNLDIIEKDN
jgi:pyruvate formate lyase activating enzyme